MIVIDWASRGGQTTIFFDEYDDDIRRISLVGIIAALEALHRIARPEELSVLESTLASMVRRYILEGGQWSGSVP
jgi:hypothetical protein